MFGQDPLDAHLQAVDAVAGAGASAALPQEWIDLRARLERFLTEGSPITQRLADAVIAGTQDTTSLRALALAEVSAMPPAHATIDAVVKHAALAKLRDIYAPIAVPNYQRLAADFDGIATKFASAANIIDPEEPAERLVHASDRLRKAWSDAEKFAHQLTEMMTALAAAANLCGIPIATQEELLALVCDPAGLHRRRVWEAWDSTGRAGRWAALVALGATIRAHDLDAFEPYRQPRPMEVRQIPVARGAVRFEQIDPEDEELAAEVVSG